MGRSVRKLAVLFGVLALAACAGTPKELPTDPSAAEPPVVFEMPEFVCVAEAQGISFIPDFPIDIFHFDDVWFWKIRDTWYWSRTYMGMLYEINPKQVPRELGRFAAGYREELLDCTEYTYEEWERGMKAAE